MSFRPWGIILAGGDGTRLKAVSRLISGDDRPKQFCSLFGGRSLLARTRGRLAPADLRARVYAAFDVHALYRAEMNQATITAKITDATPQLIQALLEDPRTDHDTHDPARKNPPISAITLLTLPNTTTLHENPPGQGGCGRSAGYGH